MLSLKSAVIIHFKANDMKAHVVLMGPILDTRAWSNNK